MLDVKRKLLADYINCDRDIYGWMLACGGLVTLSKIFCALELCLAIHCRPSGALVQ